mmetsp:Transcript_9610/g.13306  ORF Transcript_9610/g.13306 Transcript_9610/m.13306 type:complete len:261 (-) Transcript_9610:365-1147(-)|eukprot:CAMPEP_0197286260 /NCGR_PEP_ID=MMETSP0890-20130614/1715_1 /TAXON_ID=44058 ORGANISM="Aureoumbra lagunensis, Strain CCMP1510" /NCGR_SAMPLE_ID=MMETSP0890 /ASSEMBLY_ACC=CAM_ASM_000533 /LENGTH=260 /DNA_ID=CAMNT_0042754481 /DNA_START=140 /DNA_END=922 /DNA_ORIENTATION=-
MATRKVIGERAIHLQTKQNEIDEHYTIQRKCCCLNSIEKKLEWSTELLVHILEYTLEKIPDSETLGFWPVCDAGNKLADICTEDGDTLVVRGDKAFIQVHGVRAQGDENTVRSLLCTEEIQFEEAATRKGDAAYWLQSYGGRLLACSISRSDVKALAALPAGIEERQNAVHIDVIGLDFSGKNRIFSFTPRGATINRAIRHHFTKRIIVYHRIPMLLHTPSSTSGHDGFWIGAPSCFKQLLDNDEGDEDGHDDDDQENQK